MASLRKLRNKFYVRIWIDGKERLLPTGCTERRDAEKHLRKIQSQEMEVKQRIRKEIDEANKRLTITDGIRYFEKNYGREHNLRETTIYTYGLAVKDFKECYDNVGYFESLNSKHFPNLINYLENKYNSTTVNIRLRGIRAMLNYLLEKEMIDKIPFRVKQIKTDKSLPKFILPDEMEKIYNHIPDSEMSAIFRIYESTGMRLGELKESRREGEYIYVNKTKNRKERIIPIPLERIPDYDIAMQTTLSDSRISHIFSDVCKEAGLPGKTLHCLRHTFALRKLLELNNISLVKELLGHCSVKVTEIYTQFPETFLKQIFDERQTNKTSATYQRVEA
ncbi:tyrosine-type recombinase/integrase [bacterium]|nr:tyrosine-type recombinase/integrase [bacterium]